MQSIKRNWRGAGLNGIALAVMAILVWRALTVGRLSQDYNPMLADGGKWAGRFLLLSLAMTPLNSLLGWRSAIGLRQPAGLWAFAFAAAHFGLYLAETRADWLLYPIPDYIAALGAIALGILTLMAATSTRGAMKRLGKWWKRLHRLVYAAGIIGLSHGLLESSNKRVVLHDPQAGVEIGLYLAILIVLLAVRIPPVRATLVSLRRRVCPA